MAPRITVSSNARSLRAWREYWGSATSAAEFQPPGTSRAAETVHVRPSRHPPDVCGGPHDLLYAKPYEAAPMTVLIRNLWSGMWRGYANLRRLRTAQGTAKCCLGDHASAVIRSGNSAAALGLQTISMRCIRLGGHCRSRILDHTGDLASHWCRARPARTNLRREITSHSRQNRLCAPPHKLRVA